MPFPGGGKKKEEICSLIQFVNSSAYYKVFHWLNIDRFKRKRAQSSKVGLQRLSSQ